MHFLVFNLCVFSLVKLFRKSIASYRNIGRESDKLMYAIIEVYIYQSVGIQAHENEACICYMQPSQREIIGYDSAVGMV